MTPTLLIAALALLSSPDINADGAVNGADLGQIIAAWGATDPNHPCDLNGDSKVDGADLGIALSAWTGDKVYAPYAIPADRRLSISTDITVPAGSTIIDAETIGGPLWRDIRAFVLPRGAHDPMVVVYELPPDWNPDEVERANKIKTEVLP